MDLYSTIVVKESRALRWVARLCGNWTGKRVILTVHGMLQGMCKNKRPWKLWLCCGHSQLWKKCG